MEEKNNILQLRPPGLADANGRTIITPENRAEMFIAAYEILCSTHKCQFVPTVVIRGREFESSLQVQMIDVPENSN